MAVNRFCAMYDARWARTSRNWRGQHPLCVWCQAIGRPAAATVVDHRIPHRGNYDLFWDATNWQAMCKDCHAAKTRLDQTERFIDWEQRCGLVVVCGDVDADDLVAFDAAPAGNGARVAARRLLQNLIAYGNY